MWNQNDRTGTAMLKEPEPGELRAAGFHLRFFSE